MLFSGLGATTSGWLSKLQLLKVLRHWLQWMLLVALML